MMWCDAGIRHPEELSLTRTTPPTSHKRNVRQRASPSGRITANTVSYPHVRVTAPPAPQTALARCGLCLHTDWTDCSSWTTKVV